MANDLVSQYLNYAKPYARKYNLDPWAMLAVAHAESGLNPGAIGDNGQSFGYHQFYTKGAGGANARQYLDPRKNIEYAARLMAKAGASGLKGQAAIDRMVRDFERPANPGGEVQRALEFYNSVKKGGDTGGSMPPMMQQAAGAPMVPPIGSAPDPVADGRSQIMDMLMQNNQQKVDPNEQTQQLMGILQQQAQQMTAQTGKTTVAFPGVSAPLQFDDGATPTGSPSKIGNAIVRSAKQFLGVKYVWGGESPKGFDCSGLVQYVLGKYGIKTPRVSEEQFKSGQHVSMKNAIPGDLIFFRHGDGDVGHVGIYIGHGQFLHAPHTGDVVKISNLKGYGLPVAGIRRYTKGG